MSELFRSAVRSVMASLEGEVVHKFRANPEIKPPRRQPAIKNVSQRSDYMQGYMEKYRGEGKDYQKMPKRIKELRKKQRKRLKKKFNLKG